MISYKMPNVFRNYQAVFLRLSIRQVANSPPGARRLPPAHIRLTELINQQLVVLELTNGLPHKHVFGTKQVQKNNLGLIFGVPGSG